MRQRDTKKLFWDHRAVLWPNNLQFQSRCLQFNLFVGWKGFCPGKKNFIFVQLQLSLAVMHTLYGSLFPWVPASEVDLYTWDLSVHVLESAETSVACWWFRGFAILFEISFLVVSLGLRLCKWNPSCMHDPSLLRSFLRHFCWNILKCKQRDSGKGKEKCFPSSSEWFLWWPRLSALGCSACLWLCCLLGVHIQFQHARDVFPVLPRIPSGSATRPYSAHVGQCWESNPEPHACKAGTFHWFITTAYNSAFYF